MNDLKMLSSARLLYKAVGLFAPSVLAVMCIEIVLTHLSPLNEVLSFVRSIVVAQILAFTVYYKRYSRIVDITDELLTRF